jgi:hypothetical protein
MIPLLENLSPSECVAEGRKHFGLAELGSDPTALFSDLLSGKEWVTILLTLILAVKQGVDGIDRDTIEKLMQSEDKRIRLMAEWVFRGRGLASAEAENLWESVGRIPDTIVSLKGIDLLEGLTVSELATIALVTEEAVYPSGETVVLGGEAGDRMYLIVEGQVRIMEQGTEEENGWFELGRIGAGEVVGQMALFEEIPQTISVHTTERTRFLVLQKHHFEATVKEYPQIALHMCKALSARLRLLQESANFQ